MNAIRYFLIGFWFGLTGVIGAFLGAFLGCLAVAVVILGVQWFSSHLNINAPIAVSAAAPSPAPNVAPKNISHVCFQDVDSLRSSAR